MRVRPENITQMDGLIAPRHSEVTLKIREKIEQAQETASNRELGVLKELLSDSLHKDGLFQECLDALSAATDIYVGYNDLKALTRLCNKAGCTNFVMNRYKEAIELFERQTSYGMEGKKVVAACQGMTNKGVVMLLTADQEGAISTIKEAMGLLEQEVRGGGARSEDGWSEATAKKPVYRFPTKLTTFYTE